MKKLTTIVSLSFVLGSSFVLAGPVVSVMQHGELVETETVFRSYSLREWICTFRNSGKVTEYKVALDGQTLKVTGANFVAEANAVVVTEIDSKAKHYSFSTGVRPHPYQFTLSLYEDGKGLFNIRTQGGDFVCEKK